MRRTGFILRPTTGAPMLRRAVMTFSPRPNMRPVSSEVKKRKGLARASLARSMRRAVLGRPGTLAAVGSDGAEPAVGGSPGGGASAAGRGRAELARSPVVLTRRRGVVRGRLMRGLR